MMDRKSSYGHAVTAIIFFFMIFSVCFAAPAFAGLPVVFYSDLVSGPNTGGENDNGAFVTIWGRNFGNSRGTSFVTVGGGTVDNYREWSDTKVCFQLGHNAKTGTISITTSEGTGVGGVFTVRTTGTIYFVDVNSPNNPGSGTFNDPWRSPRTYYEHASPGDICYFREGVYNGTYGYPSGGGNFVVRVGEGSNYCKAGTKENPIAYVAYPGEIVVFDALGSTSPTWNFRIYSNIDPAWYVISKFYLKAYNQCIGSAGTGWRIVGNDCEGITRTSELQAGIIGTGGGSAKILGNKVHGGRSGSKMDHAIYPGGCPSAGGIEVAWNHVYDNNFARGPLISINHEGNRCGLNEYVSDCYIHDNIVDATNYPCRGITIFHMSYHDGDLVEPTAYIYNNILINCGIVDEIGRHPAIVHQNGHAFIYNNTFYNTRTYAIALYAFTGSSDYPLLSSTIKNNIFHMRSTASEYIHVDSRLSAAQLEFDKNSYYGLGDTGSIYDENPIYGDPKFVNPADLDFHLQSDSPCRDAGESSVQTIVGTDIDGLPRPQNSIYDLGAYEYNTGSSLPTPGDDTTPPVGSILINDEATETESYNVTLGLSASDSESGVSQMQFSNNNEDWSSPEFYATSKNWVLSSGLGNKTVYVKFRDGAGNWSPSYHDTIEVIDATPPSDVSNVHYLIGDGGSVTLNWSNPSDIDFDGTMIRYGTTGYPAGHDEGTLFCNRQAEPGSDDEYNSILPEGSYYFSFFTYDARDNYSQAAHLIVTVSTSGEVYSKVFGDANGVDFPGTIEDTYININNDNNFSSSNLNTYTWPVDSVANAILMKINLGSIPEGSQIQNATLYVYMNGADNGGGDDLYDVSVHKIVNHNPLLPQCTGYTYDGTHGWTPNDKCYNNVPMAQADILPAEDSQILDKTFGYKSWNITNMVRDWVQNPASNYGLLLNSDSTASSGSNRTFLSSEASEPNQRPKLVVTYSVSGSSNPDTIPPAAPTGLNLR